MMTLAAAPNYPVDHQLLAPTKRAGLGGGALSVRRQWERAQHVWKLNFPLDRRKDAEALRSFTYHHQGDRPFWFDGAEYGEIEEPIFVAFGDGATTDYFLPNRNVFAPTLVVTVHSAVVTAWTLTESSGLLVFTTAPGADAEIRAKYKCKFKCVFFYEREQLLSQSEFTSRVYANDLPAIREINP